MQQQIDLLNQESRKAAQTYESQLQEIENQYQEQLQKSQDQIAELVNSPKKDTARIKALEQEIHKLEGEAKWLRSQRDHMRKALTIQQIGGQTQELPFPFPTIMEHVEDALTRNGYTILSSMQTDQKAIFITDRKTSLPPALELSGFRNQYLLSIEKKPSNHGTLWVRAEFEKLSKNGQMFSAPQSETTEIELRLIQEIHQSLTNDLSSPVQKS